MRMFAHKQQFANIPVETLSSGWATLQLAIGVSPFSKMKTLRGALGHAIGCESWTDATRISVRVPVESSLARKLSSRGLKVSPREGYELSFSTEAGFKISESASAVFLGWNSIERMTSQDERQADFIRLFCNFTHPAQTESEYFARAEGYSFGVVGRDLPGFGTYAGAAKEIPVSDPLLQSFASLLNSCFKAPGSYSLLRLIDEYSRGTIFFFASDPHGNPWSLCLLAKDGWTTAIRGGKPSFSYAGTVTDQDHRGKELSTSLYLLSTGILKQAFPESIFRIHARASWDAVNRCARNAGFGYAGSLQNHNMVPSGLERNSGKSSPYETMNVWVKM